MNIKEEDKQLQKETDNKDKNIQKTMDQEKKELQDEVNKRNRSIQNRLGEREEELQQITDQEIENIILYEIKDKNFESDNLCVTDHYEIGNKVLVRYYMSQILHRYNQKY